jgi:hypothetical protein
VASYLLTTPSTLCCCYYSLQYAWYISLPSRVAATHQSCLSSPLTRRCSSTLTIALSRPSSTICFLAMYHLSLWLSNFGRTISVLPRSKRSQLLLPMISWPYSRSIRWLRNSSPHWPTQKYVTIVGFLHHCTDWGYTQCAVCLYLLARLPNHPGSFNYPPRPAGPRWSPSLAHHSHEFLQELRRVKQQGYRLPAYTRQPQKGLRYNPVIHNGNVLDALHSAMQFDQSSQLESAPVIRTSIVPSSSPRTFYGSDHNISPVRVPCSPTSSQAVLLTPPTTSPSRGPVELPPITSPTATTKIRRQAKRARKQISSTQVKVVAPTVMRTYPSSRKGWKGWAQLDYDPPPSERLVSVVYHELKARSTRSGRKFGHM